MSEFGIILDFCQSFLNGVQKRFSEKFAVALVEGRRPGQFIIGEPMTGDGFHAMRAGL